MSWLVGALIIVLLSSGLVAAQEQQPPSQAELAAKPPYERLEALIESALATEPTTEDFRHVLDARHAKELISELDDDMRQAAELVSRAPVVDGLIAIRRRIFGEDDLDKAARYNASAADFHSQARYAEAEQLFRDALDLRRNRLGEWHADTAVSYSNLAVNLQDQGKVAEAEPQLRQALEISLRVSGENSFATASYYHNLAWALQRLGKSADATPFFRKSLEITLRVRGEQHCDTAWMYTSLAQNLNDLCKDAEGDSLLRKAAAIVREVSGQEHYQTAVICSHLGGNLLDRGEAIEALSMFCRALDITRRKRGDVHNDTATSHQNVARALRAQGRAEDARKHLQKAYDIDCRVFGESHRFSLRRRGELAEFLRDDGHVAEAVVILEEAAEGMHRALGADHLDLAIIYNNLAVALGGLGRPDEAKYVLGKALAIRSRAQGNEHRDVVMCLNNMGTIIFKQGNAVEALPFLQKAADSHRRAYGDLHPVSSIFVGNYALALKSTGQPEEATAALRLAARGFEASRLKRAEGLERAIGDSGNPRRLLAVIGQERDPVEAWRQIELSLARGFLDQQASRRGSVTATEAERESEWQARLAALQPRILYLVSQRARSPEEETELADLIRQRNEVGNQLSELAVELSERQVERSEAIQAALAPHAALVFWVDVSVSGGLEEHFACVVRRDGGPFWAKLPGSGEQGQWTKADTGLVWGLKQALAQDGPAVDLGSLIDRARRQRFGPILEHLTQHGITQLFIVGVDEMAGVPVDVLVPEFTIGYVPSGTYLARLPGKPAYENTLLAVGDPVYRRAKASAVQVTAMPPHGVLVREAVPTGSAAQAGISPGDVLLRYGERVLESVEQLKDAIEKATVAGDTTVAVRVWRVDAENNVLEKTLSLPVGPLGVVLALEPAPAAIADARQTDMMLAGLRGGETWDDLPGTRYEVSRISELFPTARVLLDGEASERTVEGLRASGELRRYRYLHFATHGKGNDATAFESKLALSQDAETEEFSKPGEPWMNNEISAREVLDYWKLDADLVTLSACESGLGKQGAGDGLLGFTQAFLVNGARSVCLSLWKVDDTATALLMQRFYQNLLGMRPELPQPMRKVDALREAKRWLRDLTAQEALEATATLTGGVSRGIRGEIALAQRIKADRPDDRPWAEPHYWAAFILIGDPE